MYKNMKDGYNLLVMVPHPEIRQKMQDFSAELFYSGFEGAWSFPHIAPLALIQEPLQAFELKKCAALIRRHNSDEKKHSMIKCGKPACSAFPTPFPVSIFGLVLDLKLPDSVFLSISDKILFKFSPIILGASLIEKTANITGLENLLQIPQPAFRAAAIANMCFSQLPEANCYSWNWKISKLYWLPRL